MTIQEKIRQAGVVGAGGAGFPTHIKAASKVECVIANGAECEPLIHKDFELMVHFAEQVVEGVKLLAEATGASKIIIGIKEKNQEAVEALQKAIRGTEIKLHLLGDYYPTGDEYELVYECTGRLIPPAGIPIDAGIVVNNVETLYNISLAHQDKHVTHKFITVTGAVKTPATFLAPIGISYRDAIRMAGGATVSANGTIGVFVGGVMMGNLEFDLDLPVTKTTAGLIVLPSNHKLVLRKNQPERSMHRIGKSACDQCSYCTEFCPRYLLGYDVQPHKVMRSLGFTRTDEDLWNQWAQLCCACGLCTLYACPEDLFPKEACDKAKHDLKAKGIRWTGKMEVKPHPMHKARRVPLKQLVRRLGLVDYDVPAPLKEIDFIPKSVRLPISQHVGAPAESVVKVGEMVRVGQVVASVPDGQLGASIHASIDGVVKSINNEIIIERLTNGKELYRVN